VLLGLPHREVWRRLLERLPIADHGRILLTAAGTDPVGWAETAGCLGYGVVGGGAEPGALRHLLWWDPSVRAVLVAPDATPGVAAAVEDARRAIELTGSDALLLVDASGSRGLEGLQEQTRSADLVVVTLGGQGRATGEATVVAWSLRLAPALASLDDLRPLSYDVVARLAHGILA
jgi:hypothetical protein